MNELVPLTQDTPDIGSIVLEKDKMEGKKVTNAEHNNTLMSNMLYETKSLRKFQQTIESKWSLMENAIVNRKLCFGFKNTNNSTLRFIGNVLKEKISFLERKLNSKDFIIEFITKKYYHQTFQPKRR